MDLKPHKEGSEEMIRVIDKGRVVGSNGLQIPKGQKIDRGFWVAISEQDAGN